METRQKSLKLNMLLNIIKNVTAVIFPLISLPYVTRVLGVESLGKYNFCTSVMSYILLLAALGIESYAIREGSKYRNDEEKFTKFASQIFSINLLSTLMAYLVLAILMVLVPKFEVYIPLLLILSAQIFFTTVGVNWIYNIYEEFAFITLRSVIVQILSIIAMFVFIKTPDDIYKYAIITVVASVGANIFNFFYSRRFCKLKVTFKIHFKEHMKPILLLFALAATVTIYVSSDNVILGFIKGDYYVGIYSISVKIYTIVKSLLAAAIVVLIPRLSMLLGEGRNDEANHVANDIHHTIYTMSIPGVVGLIVLGEQIILLIAGDTYASAISSHIILSITMIFNLGAYFWGTAVLISVGKERVTLVATIVSAVLNVALNIVLIPHLAEDAAALTTLISEFVAFLWCYICGRKYIKVSGEISVILKSIIGSLPIVMMPLLLKFIKDSLVLYTLATVFLSVVCYVLIEILLKNYVIIDILNGIRSKITKNRNTLG